MGNTRTRIARLLVAGVVAGVFLLVCAAAACSSSSSSPAEGPDGGGLPDTHGDDARRARQPEAGAEGEEGSPHLVSLDVTFEDGGGASALVPAFASGRHDYYVRCAPGKNTLNVAMKASPGAVALLLGPEPSGARPSQSVPTVALENQAIIAAATDGRTTVEYWVRCLPHDVPLLVWARGAEAGASTTPGYYLVGDDYPEAGATGYALVLNSDGVPVWYARAPEGQGAFNVDHILPEAVSYIPITRVYTQTAYEVREIKPLEDRELAPDGAQPDFHELRVSKAGNFLITHYTVGKGYDLTGLSLSLADGGVTPLGANMAILDCGFVEFTANGTIVGTWSMSDHFAPKDVSTFPQPTTGLTAPDGGPVVDVFHCNSIDVDPSGNGLLVSARHMDSIFYVEWPGGRVLWKLGGKAAFKDVGATFLAADSPFYRQHDARFQADWSSSSCGGRGHISVYDDETLRPTNARAVVYAVVVGGGDAGPGCDAGAAPGATATWQAPAASSATAAGSLRIYADGTRLIDWGYLNPRGIVFSEVDDAGRHLLDFSYGNGDISYRAVKVPLAALDLQAMRSSAGLP